jgi:hypothetical protein
MPILRKGGCRYEERRDANAEGCSTERTGMKILRGSDADAESEQCRCRVRAMPMPSETDADAEGYQVRIPITQQLSVLLAVQCERRVWKLFQDKSAVRSTSNLL